MEKNETEILVRAARESDDAEIANVHLNSWREAYRDLLPQEFLDQLPLTFRRRQEWWQKVISDPQTFVLTVAESKAGIVGFACFGKGRDPDMSDYAEVTAIYLLEKFKGSGTGFKLLSRGLKQMSERGFTKGYCWVLEKNPTIKFYEKTGAKFSGKIKEEVIGGKPVKELNYIWESIGGF